MKKAYLGLSTLASLVIAGFLGFWLVVGGSDILFVLGTIFIGPAPLLFWFPVSLVSYGIALKLSKEKVKLKNVLYAFPIITATLFFTISEYQGP
jgi:hypothetical protein